MKDYISSHYGKCKKDICDCLKNQDNFAICSNWQKFTYENFDQMITEMQNIQNLMDAKNENKSR